MPLRAKITNPATRNLASSSAGDGDEAHDVLFHSRYGVRSIELNRPTKLNALNASMARKIIPRLQAWQDSDLANVIVAKGAGRAFCAGGDVAWLARRNETGAAGRQDSQAYFALEYALDHVIATCRKPVVAFIDGITMGGGVGLSVHAPFRIATENTVFAMPETTIGFFPDVGASFFLPRLDGQLGLYLALTSDQLKGVNVFYSGIATHYLHSTSLPDLEARLAELSFPDPMPYPDRLRIINSTIEEFTTGLPHDQPISAPVAGNVRAAVDYAFQPANGLNGILEALEGLENMASDQNGYPEVAEWAGKTRKSILQRSPTSVKVALRQLREGRSWSIAQTFRKEHVIASKFMEHPDFVEGVSSLLIRKPKTTPQWQPSSLDQVSDADVDAFFNPTSHLELLNHGNGSDYAEYPHAWIGLPREQDVRRYVQLQRVASKEDVLEHFVLRTEGKQGVREKVGEILDRKTQVGKGGLGWRQ